MNKKWKFIILTIATVILFTLFYQPTDPVISLSVSSDGRYAVSGHVDRKVDPSYPIGQLVLWDIERKTKQIISKKANAFSAMFIPDSHEFMWQDDKDMIYMQTIDGQIIKNFQHPFTIQNHRITADKSFYLSADLYNHLHLGYGENIKTVYNDGASISKPVDLSIVGNYFLSVTNTCHGPDDPVVETNLTANPVNFSKSKKSSYNGVTLWDKHTLKPIARLIGNCGATNGLISPDGKWVITGGENFINYMWSIDDLNQRLGLEAVDDSVIYREPLEPGKKHPVPVPAKYDGKQITFNHTVAISFLSEKEFVLFNKTNTDELVPVYTVGNPFIKGYVETGKPYVSTDYFQRNLSVSSSPTAHILVTGQATGGGINVYKYHPDKMELEKIWVAD
ncbi:WD40 repeat domain-containing protein [Aggregatibacter actinomycetemcomitans]|uniref:WD40 repeat domain-containing protein n=1 Tax=Aggregatibacter actinomycetemcomitans TaxID=714 RepID=UPI00197B43AE|nr:WD40 repeat domain-containing protein [Aggregatibacter actinomycetemcomitans]MBN6081179.1 WD40 repeat domain-containing protein [Aggregatibacter actinomycetemcomitans]